MNLSTFKKLILNTGFAVVLVDLKIEDIDVLEHGDDYSHILVVILLG